MMSGSNVQKISSGNGYGPVSAIQELIDNEAALQTVSAINVRRGPCCPRCKSVYLQNVNTKIFRELIRCVDCGYMFNGLSGTVFQGAKIPVMRYLQAMVIIDMSMGKVSAKDISFSLDVTVKTASAIGKKLATIPNRWTYFDFNASVSLFDEKLRIGELYNQNGNSRFLAFCHMNHLCIERDLFLNRVEDALHQNV